ncbi:MAG: GDP-mannose 4,6-dehydratase [Dehalococcoidia bacterium]
MHLVYQALAKNGKSDTAGCREFIMGSDGPPPIRYNGRKPKQFHRVLITGITGFVGPYVAKRFLERGATVSGLVKRRADRTEIEMLKWHGIHEDVRLIEGDLLGPSAVGRALLEVRPDLVVHLAAQSFVAESFHNPPSTIEVNVQGTANLLEALRLSGLTTRLLFAGSSEEYGLVISSERQLADLEEKYGRVCPHPQKVPELPITEDNPLRPVSPYAISKVLGDHLTRVYANGLGLDAVVSRAFNHEGPGRGPMFVSSSIISQVAHLKYNGGDKVVLGNVNAFRDWSHVDDVIAGYCLLAELGEVGQVYNIGSHRTNSVLTFLLWALEEAGFEVHTIKTVDGTKEIEEPTARVQAPSFGLRSEMSRADQLLLEGQLSYTLEDRGLVVHTQKGAVGVEFDPQRFRPLEVPILLCDAGKLTALGYQASRTVRDIIRDQLRYYYDRYPETQAGIVGSRCSKRARWYAVDRQ